MTAPYRDELAALEARYASLEAEVADRERARDEAARMLAEARARARNEAIAADLRAGGPQRRVMIGAALGVLVIAWSGTYLLVAHKPTRAAPMERALNEYERFADETCACKDKACTDEVQERLTKWAQRMARDAEIRDEKPDEDAVRRAAKIGERYTACVSKILTPAERY